MRRTDRTTRFELAALAAFAAVSTWVLALDLAHTIGSGWVWTGADSLYGVDQFQYMAWVQEASRHVLVSNLFVLGTTPRDYFQPAVALSGGLSALGVSPAVSLLLWKPVAVIALFFAVRGYVKRTLVDSGSRRAALILALFFGSFTVVFGSVGAIGDLFPPFLAWGYPFALLGLAAMVTGLLAYARARTNGRVTLAPGLLGLAASLLHPWNGAMLIAVSVGAELLCRREPTGRSAPLRLSLLTVFLTALPLAYYVVLGTVDLSWRLAKTASKHYYSWWAIALELAPLLLPALLAYRRRPETYLEAAGMVWPVAAFAVFGLSLTRFAATPVHAFQGITIPLSVLAVGSMRGVGFDRLPYRSVFASILVAAFTVPATAWEMNTARRASIPRVGDSDFITQDEDDALRYLARDRQPGGVIARQYLGQLVPGKTGRHTFVGDCLWSQPGCPDRLVAVRELFAGQLTAGAARRFVVTHRARFLLADCRQTVDLDSLLGTVIVAVHRFGCAVVYEVA